MKKLIWLPFLLVLSCNIEKRNIDRQHLYNYMYPSELAKDCAKTFPVKDSVGVVKVAQNKDYSGTIDSLQALLNSLPTLKPVINPVTGIIIAVDTSKYLKAITALQDKINALRNAYKPCKPDTVPHIVVDMAKLNVMTGKYTAVHDSLKAANATLKQVTSEKKGWMWAAIGVSVLFIAGIVISIYKFFSGGGIVKAAEKIV